MTWIKSFKEYIFQDQIMFIQLKVKFYVLCDRKSVKKEVENPTIRELLNGLHENGIKI